MFCCQIYNMLMICLGPLGYKNHLIQTPNSIKFAFLKNIFQFEAIFLTCCFKQACNYYAINLNILQLHPTKILIIVFQFDALSLMHLCIVFLIFFYVCTRCCMFRVCLPHQYEASYVMQSLVTLGHHDGWITWPRYESVGVKCLSQEHNDTSPILEIEP